MKPVLGIAIQEGLAVEPEYVAEVCQQRLDREFGLLGEQACYVRLLSTDDELRAWQAGELVLYRKPARRHGNTIVYRDHGGHEVKLEQETIFKDEAGSIG